MVGDLSVRIGVVGKQRLLILVIEADVLVLDDSVWGVAAEAQPVAGQQLYLCLRCSRDFPAQAVIDPRPVDAGVPA